MKKETKHDDLKQKLNFANDYFKSTTSLEEIRKEEEKVMKEINKFFNKPTKEDINKIINKILSLRKNKRFTIGEYLKKFDLSEEEKNTYAKQIYDGILGYVDFISGGSYTYNTLPCIKNERRHEKATLRKTMLDENGKEFEVEEKLENIDFPDDLESLKKQLAENKTKEYSQKEFHDFFYYNMNENEIKKIQELNIDDIIMKITTPSYNIKYINNVGYVFTGKGYLILDDGSEPVHYFAQIFNSAETAKKEILKLYNKEKLQEIVKNFEIDYTNNLISDKDLEKFESIINCKFGEQLKQYLLKYGYMGYKSIEFYGINSKQLEKSDMITQSLYLHEYFPKTKGLIAFENKDGHNFALVDSEDKMHYYNNITDEMIDVDTKLYDFIFNQFKFVSSESYKAPSLDYLKLLEDIEIKYNMCGYTATLDNTLKNQNKSYPNARLLTLEEILNAPEELNVDFVSHGLLPVFDIFDNDLICYQTKDGKWCKFNIVDEVSYKKDSTLAELLDFKC